MRTLEPPTLPIELLTFLSIAAALQREIAKHNAAIAAKRLAKRQAKAERRRNVAMGEFIDGI